MSKAKPAPKRPHFYAGLSDNGNPLLRVSYLQPYDTASDWDHEAQYQAIRNFLHEAGIKMPGPGQWVEIELTARKAGK